METERTQAEKISRAEILSAIADDEALDSLDYLLAELDQSDRARWLEYHLIGDAVRAIDFAGPEAGAHTFLARFSKKLAAEPPLCPPISCYKKFLQRLYKLRLFLLSTTTLAAIPVMLTWMMVAQLQPEAIDLNMSQATFPVLQQGSPYRLCAPSALSSCTARDDNAARFNEALPYFEAHQQFAPHAVMGPALVYIRTTAHLQ